VPSRFPRLGKTTVPPTELQGINPWCPPAFLENNNNKQQQQQRQQQRQEQQTTTTTKSATTTLWLLQETLIRATLARSVRTMYTQQTKTKMTTTGRETQVADSVDAEKERKRDSFGSARQTKTFENQLLRTICPDLKKLVPKHAQHVIAIPQPQAGDSPSGKQLCVQT